MEKQTEQTILKEFYFEADKTYDIKLEFFESAGNANIKLVWDVTTENKWQQQIEEAVKAAQNSDIAVVFAGIHEGEFQDRAMLSLPGHQEEMILAIAATGKPTVVVLVGGSAITMSNWINEVDGILMAWYPGENGGNSFADVFFGDENPAGRLPVTFPVDVAQCPLYYNHKPTGRGDNYHNLTGQPLFPFGYGLSYTSFEYSNLRFSKNIIGIDDSIEISCTVKNIGKLKGDEVIQLYIRDEMASVLSYKRIKGLRANLLKIWRRKRSDFYIEPS